MLPPAQRIAIRLMSWVSRWHCTFVIVVSFMGCVPVRWRKQRGCGCATMGGRARKDRRLEDAEETRRGPDRDDQGRRARGRRVCDVGIECAQRSRPDFGGDGRPCSRGGRKAWLSSFGRGTAPATFPAV